MPAFISLGLELSTWWMHPVAPKRHMWPSHRPVHAWTLAPIPLNKATQAAAAAVAPVCSDSLTLRPASAHRCAVSWAARVKAAVPRRPPLVTSGGVLCPPRTPAGGRGRAVKARATPRATSSRARHSASRSMTCEALAAGQLTIVCSRSKPSLVSRACRRPLSHTSQWSTGRRTQWQCTPLMRPATRSSVAARQANRGADRRIRRRGSVPLSSTQADLSSTFQPAGLSMSTCTGRGARTARGPPPPSQDRPPAKASASFSTSPSLFLNAIMALRSRPSTLALTLTLTLTLTLCSRPAVRTGAARSMLLRSSPMLPKTRTQSAPPLCSMLAIGGTAPHAPPAHAPLRMLPYTQAPFSAAQLQPTLSPKPET